MSRRCRRIRRLEREVAKHERWFDRLAAWQKEAGAMVHELVDRFNELQERVEVLEKALGDDFREADWWKGGAQ